MHLFHLLFKDIKIFFICHKVLGVPTIIWPFLGLQKQLHNLSQLHMLVIIFSFTKAQEETNLWLNILATIFH